MLTEVCNLHNQTFQNILDGDVCMLLQLHVLYATLSTFFVIGLNNMHAQKIRDWIRLHRHAVIVSSYIHVHLNRPVCVKG